MTVPGSNPPPGWYPDPAGGHGERYWDGVAWSQSTRDVPQPGPQEASMPAAPYVPYGYGQQVPYSYAQPVATGPQYAGFWWRVLGFVVDNIILSIVVQFIQPFLPATAMAERAMEKWMREYFIWVDSPAGQVPLPGAEFWTAIAIITVVTIVVQGLYRTLMLGFLGATAGQLAVGVRVVKDGDEPTAQLSWGLAILRGFLGAVLWQTLSIFNGLFAAILPKKQTLSDLVSKTVVYKVR